MGAQLTRDLAQAMRVVEVAHLELPDLEAWLGMLLETLRPLVPEALHGSAMVLERGEGEFRVLNAILPGAFVDLAASLDTTNLALFDAYFSRTHVFTDSAAAALRQYAPEEFYQQYQRAAEGPDSLGLCARVGSYGLFLNFSVCAKLDFSKAELRLLTRLALHVEASLELRMDPWRERLILRPDGKILHRSPDSSPVPEAELGQHVREVEGARSRRRRKTPEALAIWTALAQGRFGLVERNDRDGRRCYVLVERVAAPSRMLSGVEKRSIELAARGLSGKMIAYSQGVSEASVSHALARAAFKLGCRNRAELVRLASHLVSSNPGLRGLENLSEAERQVLELLRQGRANAEIASERGTSVRTVANQVSSVLQKTGLSSRRAVQVSATAAK